MRRVRGDARAAPRAASASRRCPRCRYRCRSNLRFRISPAPDFPESGHHAGFRKRFRALEQTGRATDPMSVCPPTGGRHIKSGPLVEAGRTHALLATCSCCGALCVNVALFSCGDAISAFQAVTRKILRGSLCPAAGQRAVSVSSISPRGRSGRRAFRLRSGLAIACLGLPLGGDALQRRRHLSMSLESRIKELSDRHKRLEAAIAAELKHPAGDDVRIHELKRKKLRLKDEIATLRTN
jgi:hypothetical protein